jgi:S-adenosylmethionine hydrolase
MARQPRKARPIVTLTTDFGWEDSYVAEMKGVLLSLVPDVQLVDVTHDVSPQDVVAGSIVLERVVRLFPPGTVHLAVVDPGVGSERKLLVVRVREQFVVCPDNGLITWTWRRHPGAVAHELTWRPPEWSATFHGRDVMAPLAGRIAAGNAWPKLCRPMHQPRLLDLTPARSLDEARVIHVDHFGNATTNVPGELLNGVAGVHVVRSKCPLRRTYADVAKGKPLALIGSSGLLEIAVRDGSAARQLRLRVGHAVRCRLLPSRSL